MSTDRSRAQLASRGPGAPRSGVPGHRVGLLRLRAGARLLATEHEHGAAAVLTTLWSRRLVVAAVVAAALLALAVPVWRENERRYTDLRMTGCFGDSAPSLGVSQECTGNVRRLCRDAPPLIDWRRFCQ